MNWNEIKEKYRKAYLLMIKQLDSKRLLDINAEPRNIRDLYDFFDEQGILIIIDKDWEYMYSDDMERRYLKTWNYEISQEPFYGDSYETRTEAEQAAFEKAFEILERRL